MPTKPRGARRSALKTLLLAAICGTALITGARAADPVRGVTDTEIVIGTITDLSGVTAIQGVNNSQAIRMAFDEANEKGGVHGRKIKYIVEDNQYQVPRAVQAMNKMLNRDNVFVMVNNGGTPMNNANMPTQLEHGVPNVFPLTAARSMYEPFNRLKFGQFASYYDQMRAGVKYFVEQKGKKRICAMYQDTDFGRDVLAGVKEQVKVMGLEVVGETAHKPTDTDFTAMLTRLRDAKCDLVTTGTIVRDTTLILGTARKMGWDVDFLGQFASYDTAVAEAPGGVGEGYYAVTPSLIAYPDDPRPAVQKFARDYKARFGIAPNFLGEMGYSAAQITLLALDRAGRDLTLDSFIKGMESIKDYHDIFGSPPLTLSATQHHGSTQAWLAVVKDGKWVPAVDHPLGY
ncbi:MAG: ABC transporter substrate-binding protein [Alphaproteobacteria bacterium]|nr:ABC transporter substrate-binding protein [Alphaproteobacteria bacterium]